MRAALSRFRKAQDGLAAVEFGFLLPVMLTFFFGLVEVSLALSCRADVDNVAATAADLTAQASNISTNDMNNVFSAASAIMYPNDTSVGTITVTSVIYDTTSKSLTSGKVDWSCTKYGTARGNGSTVSLPAGLMTANGSVIMSEVTYNYTSPTSRIITGPLRMTHTFYTKPRRVSKITGPTASNCP
ncbi:MAG TPA: TadE/TadG family type IV pilus assembly protein [Rhizomicrobium sp.]